METIKKEMTESCQTRRMYGHNYAVPGTYEVTIVVTNRRPVFGEIVGSTRTGGETPHLKPSALGLAVLNNEIPKIHHYYPMVDVWQVCLMPDHLHLIVRINEPLPVGKHLGIIIGAFKGGVSRAWWQILETTVPEASASETPLREPLFEPNYNDHILMRNGQLENWKHYLRDNPRRLMMRIEYPDLFRRTLCIVSCGLPPPIKNEKMKNSNNRRLLLSREPPAVVSENGRAVVISFGLLSN